MYVWCRVLLQNPGWAWIYSVDQAVFKLAILLPPPLSSSQYKYPEESQWLLCHGRGHGWVAFPSLYGQRHPSFSATRVYNICNKRIQMNNFHVIKIRSKACNLMMCSAVLVIFRNHKNCVGRTAHACKIGKVWRVGGARWSFLFLLWTNLVLSNRKAAIFC